MKRKISIRRVFYLSMKNIANKGIAIEEVGYFVNLDMLEFQKLALIIVLIKLSLPYIKAALLTNDRSI